MAPASSRIERDEGSSYFDSPERLLWLSALTPDSLVEWRVKHFKKQWEFTLEEILMLEEKTGFHTTRWRFNRLRGFQPISTFLGRLGFAGEKEENIPPELLTQNPSYDENAIWIFCKDGNERGMKEVPGEGLEQTILDDAVKLLRKLVLDSSPQDTEPSQDCTTTHLDGNESLPLGTSPSPALPDFPYLALPPGDTAPLAPLPIYSEVDNLRVVTEPVEPTTAVTIPAHIPPSLVSPLYNSPPPTSSSSPSPTNAFPINAVPDITIRPPSSTPSPSAALPPIDLLSLSPMSSLSSPQIPPSPSTMPSVPPKKTKGKKGKKGKKKEKAERKASKMAAAATNPAGPSSDEGLDQPPTPSSSSSSTVINTPVTGEMPSSPSAQQTPLTFEATSAASIAEVEVTGEVAVNAEVEIMASLPAPQPLTFEATKTAPAVEVAVTGDVAVDVESEMPQSLLAGPPLTFETTTAAPSAEVAVTGDVTTVDMEIAASPSAPPPTTKPAEAATYADFDLTMCPAYPPYWHIACHGKSYFCWQHEDGHMEPVDVATLERDDAVPSCLFYPPCTQHQPSKSCWCPDCVGSLRFCCCYHYPLYCNYPYPPVPAPMEPWWAEQWRYEQQNLGTEDQQPVAKSQVLEPGKMSAVASVPKGKKVEVVEPASVLERVVADKQPTPKPESVADAEQSAPSASRLTTPVESTRKKKKKKKKNKFGKKSSPPPPLPPTPTPPGPITPVPKKTSALEVPMPTEAAAFTLFECEEMRRPISGASGCFSEPPGFLDLPSLSPFVSTRRAASHIRRVLASDPAQHR
ncbi:hypothetical protein N7486_003912 [Penicillium sp. IBT 16267x]|nr:hypothetical protein N7486_003912 [Penicillium sp. IBT 16267x]